jgi:hypothetical protein
MISYISAKVQRLLFQNLFGQIQIMSHFQSQFAIKSLKDHQTDQKEKMLLSLVFGLHFQKSQKLKVKKMKLQQKVRRLKTSQR